MTDNNTDTIELEDDNNLAVLADNLLFLVNGRTLEMEIRWNKISDPQWNFIDDLSDEELPDRLISEVIRIKAEDPDKAIWSVVSNEEFDSFMAELNAPEEEEAVGQD